LLIPEFYRTNKYNKVHVRWTTHKPFGLSNKDTKMASFCDKAGKTCEEVSIRTNEAQAKEENNADTKDYTDQNTVHRR